VVEGPSEFAGGVMAALMQRRGMIIGSQEDGVIARVEAEVPLAEMFGYATSLRSATQGKAEFTMEFSRYLQVPQEVATELVAKAQAKKEGKQQCIARM
jgi:elongation factor G